MSRTDALERGRAAAAAGMTDTCRIGTEKRATKLNDHGLYDIVFEAAYEGPCEFKAGNTAATEIEAAGQLLVEKDATLKLPIGLDARITSGSSEAVSKDMVVVVLASAHDPALVGTRARVTNPFASSHATSRRFPVEVTN